MLAACLSPCAARADGDVIIELKGAPPRVERVEKPDSPPAATAPTGQQHVAVVPRGVGRPVPSVPSPQRSYGQLAVTLPSETPIFQKPDARSKVLSRVGARQYLVIRKQLAGWYAVLMADGSTGYVPATHVELQNYRVTEVQLATRWEGIPTLDPSSATALGRAVIEEAYRFLGTPYVWGGNDARGIDCSGLVKRCFGACGMNLPRTATEQAGLGMAVEYADLQPGDRLYFAVHRPFDHTGIYIAGGYFIHSSKSRNGVAISHLSEPLYARSLAAARR
jgi:cell wall-associated NlpC family hydrolase